MEYKRHDLMTKVQMAGLLGVDAGKFAPPCPQPSHVYGPSRLYYHADDIPSLKAYLGNIVSGKLVPPGYSACQVQDIVHISSTAFRYQLNRGAIPRPAVQWRSRKLYSETQLQEIKAFFAKSCNNRVSWTGSRRHVDDERGGVE